MKLYQTLAADIAAQIAQGVLREGERIPSVRETSRHRKLSISTVIRAYLLLESQGAIESRPQSGYFVRRRSVAGTPAPHAAAAAQPSDAPAAAAILARLTGLDGSELALSTMRAIREGSLPLGSPYPDSSLFPTARLYQLASGLARRSSHASLTGDLPPGHPELIRQIARRHLCNGMLVDAKEVVVTLGATEAINLCLQAVAKPGDAIAVESPTYYALLHAIQRKGMRAVEVPTDPVAGIDLDALERAIREQGVAACIVTPNFQNPLGFRMSDARKRALVKLITRYQLPLIEDDVYQELYYADGHPGSLKCYDTEGLVLHCNSFSKSLSPTHRIGWALPGRFRAEVEKLKFLSTLSTPALPQMAIAAYLEQEGYDYHLRRLRKLFAQQANIMASAVQRFFPPGTEVSHPQGGYVLWVGLPPSVPALVLYALAQERGISIGAGNMFATGAAFDHHIRLNFSYRWNAATEEAIRTLGRLAAQLAAQGTAGASIEAIAPARSQLGR